MTEDILTRRIRVANPVRTAATADAELMHSIVSGPGDPRFRGRSTRSGARQLPARRLAVVLTIAVVGGASAVAAADGGAFGQALSFFETPSSDAPGPTSAADAALWTESVIPSSVRDAATVTIPGVGSAQFWYAQTTQGGWCSALKLPDGNWAGTTTGDPMDGGGSSPGCQPTREQVNAAGSRPIYGIDGFDYNESLIEPHGYNDGDPYWRVYFGTVSTAGDPVSIVETASGVTAPVEPGGLFALAILDADPASELPPNGIPFTPHFVAQNATGAVVADTPLPASISTPPGAAATGPSGVSTTPGS